MGESSKQNLATRLMMLTHIVLTERQPRYLDKDDLSEEAGRLINRRYRSQIEIESPSIQTEGRWRLHSLGWVGWIPAVDGLTIELRSKTPIVNIFSMLTLAYKTGLKFPEGLVGCRDVRDLYEKLASILAQQTLSRVQTGVYRKYMEKKDVLPYVAGRLDVPRFAQRPWAVKPVCAYEEYTPDIEDNQILTWALYVVLHSGLCSPATLLTVQRAYRVMRGLTRVQALPAHKCLNRLYNRLNDDYRTMHALSWFFLANRGPTHVSGGRQIIPFLVQMDRLFEDFVAQWIERHLPSEWELGIQVPKEAEPLRFVIDMVLYERASQHPICVVDTKYKVPDKPSHEDINQVVTYAKLVGCHEAVLVYPEEMLPPLDVAIGDIHVRSAAFPLDSNLDAAGKSLLAKLLQFNRWPD